MLLRVPSLENERRTRLRLEGRGWRETPDEPTTWTRQLAENARRDRVAARCRARDAVVRCASSQPGYSRSSVSKPNQCEHHAASWRYAQNERSTDRRCHSGASASSSCANGTTRSDRAADRAADPQPMRSTDKSLRLQLLQRQPHLFAAAGLLHVLQLCLQLFERHRGCGPLHRWDLQQDGWEPTGLFGALRRWFLPLPTLIGSAWSHVPVPKELF